MEHVASMSTIFECWWMDMESLTLMQKKEYVGEGILAWIQFPLIYHEEI